IEQAALGSALNSTGTASGFFAGGLDEARIWNYARTAAQIASGKDREIAAASGLLGRWSFNECCGQVPDSSGHTQNGTMFGSSWTWVAGGPLTGTANAAPAVDAGLDQTITLPAQAALAGTVTDDGLPGGDPIATWTKVSGPGTVTFAQPNEFQTTAAFSSAGTYVLMLSASDGVLTGSDTLTVI